MKGLSLVGQEKVPHGFGLRSGNCGSDTDVGAGTRVGSLSHRLLFLFLRYPTPDWPDWAKRGRKDCVCLWVFVNVLNKDIKSLL